MVSLVELTVNAQPYCSAATMKRWVARLSTKNKLLAKKNRPTLTIAEHGKRLQISLMKHTATRLMLAKRPPKPRNSVKRKYDTFNDPDDDPGGLSVSGRRYHKKRRIKSPEADQILEKFEADPHGFLFQPEEVVEISDCAVFGWWQCLYMVGLWPILPADAHPAKAKTEFFFNVLIKRNGSTNSQLRFTDNQEIHVAEEAGEEKSSDMPNDNFAVAQDDMQEILDVIYGGRTEVGEGSTDTDEDQSTDHCPTEYSPEELRLIIRATDGGAAQPVEYSPEQPRLGQVDIPNILTDRMETDVSHNTQEPLTALEGGSDEQEEPPILSPAAGPIRNSPRRGQKGTCRSSPYDKSLRGSLALKTKQSKNDTVKCPENPCHSAKIASVQYQESDTIQKTDINYRALQPAEAIKSTSPRSHQINVADADADDSGYASDDGLDQAFADAAEEIEQERASIEEKRAMYPWKPLVSSPLKNEVHAEEEIPPKTLQVNSRATKFHQAPLSSDERKKIWDHIALIYDLESRDFNKTGIRIHKKHCCIGDHRDRDNCRCRSTAVARCILGISDGHLTPERIRKATHQQLKLLARLDDCYGAQKEVASDAVVLAYETLEKLGYAVSYLDRGMPGLADLENHAEQIYQTHELVHAEHMGKKYRDETEEQQEQRRKCQLIKNKGRLTPTARRIARAPRRDQCQDCKRILPRQRPWESGWHRHLKEERVHACHRMPALLRGGMREPEGLFSWPL